ncbi:type I restriction enzyme, S subunit [Geoalkalibacter ferrihydriticus]|uniref:Type I restriction enzyme, S subunit n=1 Tax=Geoalkalibacter ferrihydriticus TaxID=392333 RepID=A0A1G9QNF0_9BACT|nr:restriction endonuclease subunit S [Geoalkalibacter ferrihydriticus]SDM12528.1 type I restriction enzyme, S subunit [Geoalkalibacter ferrihydriticus]
MSAEWPKVQLQDIAELKGGYAFKSEDYTDAGRFVLRTVNIDSSGRINREGTTFVSEETAKEYERFALQPWDTLFVMVGATLGKTGIVKECDLPALLNQNMWVVRAKDGRVNQRYLYYAFTFKSKDLLAWASGAAREFVRRDDFRTMELALPPREVQDQVADYIGAIDDKIELNRQINQTLEQIAQTIFKSWFVDFEPVKGKIEAKAAGRDPERAAICAISGKSEVDQLSTEQRQQLAATAALFPGALVESELGLIPEGWRVEALPDAIEVNPSRTLKRGVMAPYLDMANVPTNSARVCEVVQREFSSGSKFMNGDSLLARITPCLENGKTAYVDFLTEQQVGWGSTEFIVLRPRAPLPQAFGYLLCRHPEFRAFAIANMSGTSGRQRVPNDCFVNYQIAVPGHDVTASFGEIVGGIFSVIKARDEESRTLATLRDTLLWRTFNC